MAMEYYPASGGPDPDDYPIEDYDDDMFENWKFWSEFGVIIGEDDKEKFMSFVKESWARSYCGSDGMFNPKLFHRLCSSRAVKCVKALLQGEIMERKVDVNTRFRNGTFPLHEAAAIFSYDMVDLLLHHNARTDVLTRGPDVLCGLLPLNVAVENACLHKYLEGWTRNDSIFKLFILLCLPEMKPFLDVIGLLARHTDKTFDEFCSYVQHRNMVQMAILLMAARKEIMDSTFVNKDGVAISGMQHVQSYISSTALSIVKEEVKLAMGGICDNKRCFKQLEEKKQDLLSTSLLLEILEKTVDALDEFFSRDLSNVSQKDAIEYIASLLRQKGFAIEEQDVSFVEFCCYHGIKNVKEKLAEVEGNESENSASSNPGKHDLTLQHKVSSGKVYGEMFSGFIPRWKCVLSSPNFLTVPTFSDGRIVDFCTMNLSYAKENAKENPYLANFLSKRVVRPNYQSRRQFSTVASAVMKIIRHV